MYAFWGHIDMLEEVTNRMGSLGKNVLERFNVTCRPMNPKRFNEDLAIFLDCYNRSLVSTWGFVPMSDGEVRQQRRLKRMIVPELTTIAEIDGKPVGTMFALLTTTRGSSRSTAGSSPSVSSNSWGTGGRSNACG